VTHLSHAAIVLAMIKFNPPQGDHLEGQSFFFSSHVVLWTAVGTCEQIIAWQVSIFLSARPRGLWYSPISGITSSRAMPQNRDSFARHVRPLRLHTNLVESETRSSRSHYVYWSFWLASRQSKSLVISTSALWNSTSWSLGAPKREEGGPIR
jgi:hypothetical protein